MLLKISMVDLKQQAQQGANQDKAEKKDDTNGNQQQKGFRPEEQNKDPDAIPTLKYGPSNSLMRCKEALSKKALLEFGKNNKLIDQ